MGFSYSADNDRRFRNGLDRAKLVTSDLRVPFTLIAKDFYRSQKAIWQLSGPGQYDDLSESTKKQKSRRGIAIYPILGGSSRSLEQAAAVEGGVGNITNIGKLSLVMGVDSSTIPYAIYHQSDKPRKKIPLRKFIFIGPEAKQFATSDMVGRLERWLNIMNSFIMQKLRQQGYEVHFDESKS